MQLNLNDLVCDCTGITVRDVRDYVELYGKPENVAWLETMQANTGFGMDCSCCITELDCDKVDIDLMTVLELLCS